MKKRNNYLIFFVFALVSVMLASCLPEYDISPVDPERTYGVAYELAGVIGMRPNPDPDSADETAHPPSPGVLAAGEYLYDLFNEYGLGDVHYQNFEFYKYRNDDRPCNGRNIVGTLTGTLYPESIIVVGAHYDSIPGGIGSEDNASGVAVMMEIAHYFSENPPAYTMRFVAFDAEERGESPEPGLIQGKTLNGSRYYHDQAVLSGEVDKTVLMYNLDEAQSNYSDPLRPNIWFLMSDSDVLNRIFKDVKARMGRSGIKVRNVPKIFMMTTGRFLSDIENWRRDEVQYVWPWAFAPGSVYHAQPGDMDQISREGLAITAKMSLSFLIGVQVYPPEQLNPSGQSHV